MATSAALPWMEKPCAVRPPQRIAAHIPTTANTPTRSRVSRMTASRRSPRRARRASPKTSAGGVAAGLAGALPALCSVTCAGGASAANGAPQEIQEPLSESFCAPQEGQNMATSFSACCDGSQRMPEMESHKNLALNTGGPPGTATVYRVCSGLLGFFGGAANDRNGCSAVGIIAANGDQETHGGAIVAGDHSAVRGLEKAGLGVELAAVERHDLSRGITGLEDVSGHRAFRRAELEAAFFALGAGIEGDAQLRFTHLGARAHGDLSAGSVDADLTGAIHVDAAGKPPQAERHGHPTQNAQADEHADDNQNNLERTSALRCAGSGWRGSCSRRGNARRASAHGGSAGSTEIVSLHQRRTTFRAKVGHGTLLVQKMPVYRNFVPDKKSKVSECYSLGCSSVNFVG